MPHLNYYIDLCAEVFIVNDGAVLLRSHDKYNKWLGPGGHIDPGEDINEAALREVMEETGQTVELVGPPHWKKIDVDDNADLVPPMFMNRHRINETHEHSSCIFAARSHSRDINPQDGEDDSVEFRWLTLEELEALAKEDPKLKPDVFRYAKTALKWCA